MKIRKLLIKNYRGIKEFDWCLPSRAIFCLIGQGDSSKSTILNAIRNVFYPNWNLVVNDTDFHQCNTDTPIVIEASLGDLSKEFCSLNKYGHYLRGWENETLTLFDEPDDHLESILTVRLMIMNDLEPKWSVICDRNPDGVDFITSDRRKVNAEFIGAFNERQLSWANGTPVSKLTDIQNLSEYLANASREARTSLDNNREVALKQFDEAAFKSENIAKQLGVPVKEKYKAQLDYNSMNIKIGGLALHDGNIPLRQLGLGSRRMLLCGIQKLTLTEGHITLFDELEFGLEPHRITRLIKNIGEDELGQYFLTTHSPCVLREFTIEELYVVHNTDGNVEIVSAAKKKIQEDNVQGKIRLNAEAFLAKKVVICEGATEVGFIRGFDDYQLNSGKDSLSYHGVALLDARGASKIKAMAIAFHNLFYSVFVLADGDAPNQFSDSDINELNSLGISVQVWADSLSLEERAMKDLPWDDVRCSLKLAENDLGYPVYDNVRSQSQESFSQDIETWSDSSQMRTSIGKAAKKSAWYKDITRGDLWFKAISSALNDPDYRKTDLALGMDKLWNWIEND
jgi:putative ATP-dependent endonuclease of the OLD family